jgi:signal transduction histidine kinase
MVERVRRLVLDVLYFTKERVLEVKRVKVADFIQGVLSLASPKIRHHQIELVMEMAVDPGEFEVDEGSAAPALLNILENAVDACAADRSRPLHHITLRVQGQPNQVIFEIADDGIGMAPEIREHIFDLFFSSKGQAGTGLGLFITRQVIQQHGGRIDVESVLGEGTVFRVRLPRVLPNSEKEPSPDTPS